MRYGLRTAGQSFGVVAMSSAAHLCTRLSSCGVTRGRTQHDCWNRNTCPYAGGVTAVGGIPTAGIFGHRQGWVRDTASMSCGRPQMVTPRTAYGYDTEKRAHLYRLEIATSVHRQHREKCLSTTPSSKQHVQCPRDVRLEHNPTRKLKNKRTTIACSVYIRRRTSASSLLSFSSHELSRDADQDDGGAPRLLSAMVCACKRRCSLVQSLWGGLGGSIGGSAEA